MAENEGTTSTALRPTNNEDSSRAKGKIRETSEQLRQSTDSLIQVVGAWLRSGPVSVIISVLLVLMFTAALLFGRNILEQQIAAGIGRGWWTIFTAFLWADNLRVLIGDVIAMLTIGIWLERSIGSKWFAIIGVGTYSLGVIVSIAAVRVITIFDPEWGKLLAKQEMVGVLSFLVAVAAAASVKMNPLWRRRIRVLVGTILLMMVAFAGTLGTIFTLLVALMGWGIGNLLWGKDRARSLAVNRGPQDGRAMVALIVVGVVIGTLVSLRSPQMIGALSSLKYTVSSTAISSDLVSQICDVDSLAAQCKQYEYLYANNGLGSRLLAMMPLLMQLVLAWGLKGGRRAAWVGTVVLQGATALVATVSLLYVWSEIGSWDQGKEALGFNDLSQPTARIIVPIIVPLILLIIVMSRRSLFTVRAKPGTYRTLWKQMGEVIGVTWVITVIIGLMMGATSSVWSTITVLTTDFFIRLLPSSVLSLVTPQMTEESVEAVILMGWMPIIPWLTLGILLGRSFENRFVPGAIKRKEYVELVRQTDAGSMGWIGTWDGNQYWGSQKYAAGIAYRSGGNVALTVSDPACRPNDLDAVMREFVDFCWEQGLVPAFYSVHQPVCTLTDSWGWTRLQVAEETVLELPDLEFRGKKFQDVRTALNRAKKEGIETEWTTFEQCKPAYLAQIKQISAQWVDDKPLPEMGFTLGGVAELNDPEVRILLAVDEEGTVHGVTSWMPIYEEGQIIGWTLDFMRRLEGGFRPVVEYLIASAALWAKEAEYQVLSLSGAPLAKSQKRGESGAGISGTSEEEASSSVVLDQLLEVLGQTLEPVYGFRSLLAFKSKFKPEYVPVFLTLPTVASLPAVGLAISHAYLPDLNLTEALKLGTNLRKK